VDFHLVDGNGQPSHNSWLGNCCVESFVVLHEMVLIFQSIIAGLVYDYVPDIVIV
jgi:hypothetical protein